MDNQSYLNEISATVQPAKKPKASFLKNKFVLVGIIGVVSFSLIAIIGLVLGNGKTGVKEQVYTLELRLSNLIKTIDEYQPSVKSSDLRSNSASLKGILSNTNNGLEKYIADEYKGKTAEKKLTESEESRAESLNNELFQAKINGILDRIYAHKMAYEISLLMTMEDKLYDASKNETLHSVLDSSYDSMKNLHDKFDQFSEAK